MAKPETCDTEGTIVLLHRDLRLLDHAPFVHAAKRGWLLPVFILDKKHIEGAASNWWLHHSLLALDTQLNKQGLPLILRQGDPITVLRELQQQTQATAIYWHERYDPNGRKADQDIMQHLGKSLQCQTFQGSLLFAPDTLLNKQGTPFKVFTPFWKHCLSHLASPREPLAMPDFSSHPLPSHLKQIASDTLESWQLCPKQPNWASEFSTRFTPGEDAAFHKAEQFISDKLAGYSHARDIPATHATSELSPHLHFGEISPASLFHLIQRHALLNAPLGEKDSAKFLAELGWREFAHYLLYHFPHILSEPFQANFSAFPWHNDRSELFRAWCQGKTGYPLVDAGMRELWQTGYMHNRVRMIVASFLTKDLRIHWQKGAAWFFDTLLDADIANNTTSWQWVAGCGADAAPYFRIFNPITQSQKFDPDGTYIRRYIPELATLEAKYIHAPWLAPEITLKKAGIELGKQYPLPIVAHDQERKMALAAYAKIKKDRK